jgi:hypothetical protein
MEPLAKMIRPVANRWLTGALICAHGERQAGACTKCFVSSAIFISRRTGEVGGDAGGCVLYSNANLIDRQETNWQKLLTTD